MENNTRPDPSEPKEELGTPDEKMEMDEEEITKLWFMRQIGLMPNTNTNESVPPKPNLKRKRTPTVPKSI